MALYTVLFLALTILAAQCAVLKEVPDHPRDKRSPHDPCDDDSHWHPHHHGPPPYFASRNWSGFSRGPPGFPPGVFSGAAATANLGLAAPSAYSVASSSAGSGSSGSGSGGYGSQSGGYGGQQAASLTAANSNSGNFAGGPLPPPPPSGGASGQQLGSSSGAYHGSGYGSGQSGSYKDSHEPKGFGEQQQIQNNLGDFKDHSVGYGKASSSASSQQSNTAGFGQNSGQFESNKGPHNNHNEFKNQGFEGQQQVQDNFGKSSANSGSYSQPSPPVGALQNGQNFGHGQNGESKDVEHFQGNEQQQQSSDSRGQWQQGGYGSSSGSHGSNLGAYGSGSGSYGSGSGGYGISSGGHEANSDSSSSQNGSQGSLGHGALSGALNLASQGLQTSQGLQSGCSTCSKGYALSNAKSKSGDAVAVSIGG